MATVVTEMVTNPLPFQTMIATQQPHDTQYHSTHRRSLSPRFVGSDSRFSHKTESIEKQRHCSVTSSASRLPSPPSSSSESLAESYDNGNAPTGMAPDAQVPVEPSPEQADDSQSASFVANSIPSPDSDARNASPNPAAAAAAATAPPSLVAKPRTKEPPQPPECTTIHVRDLKHIHELAKNHEMGNGPGILNEPPLQSMKYEISAMPIHDIIEMVAALLTKITTTNDLQHDAMSRNATHQQHASSHNEGNREMSPFSSSVLAFHGKNVPAITILSYLARIHKYCPTTYEVFLSLLVYFDRMTERVNGIVMKSEQERQQRELEARSTKFKSEAGSDEASEEASEEADVVMHEPSSDDLTDDDQPSPAGTSAAQPTTSGRAPATYFVVDSFNIHRLIIAGVTCASKFFSDVFYTNSRYAKVGGLPLAELNHLELQFLLLNDFRLSVAVEDLEAYATMLVEFYAREVVSKESRRSRASA